MTKLITSIQQWKKIRKSFSNGKTTLGFVPTMGALHQGHASLIQQSKKQNKKTLVSIFVNPTQFDDPNDFHAYPITLSQDMHLLTQLKVDYVLHPTAKEIYNDEYRYVVHENKISKLLCGAHRKGHFEGVLTIVLKLLNIAQADRAYFGEKDYQQYMLVRDMVQAFFLSTKIIACKTIREQDGLAKSSRNQRLTSLQRRKAALFPQLLHSKMRENKISQQLKKIGFSVDYIESMGNRRFGAVRLGKIRLIDNVSQPKNVPL